LQDVPHTQTGLASGVLNTAMEIGPPLGLAVLAPLATTSPAHGYATALRVAAAALFLTALCSLPMRRPKSSHLRLPRLPRQRRD
jgi:cyanate permease